MEFNATFIISTISFIIFTLIMNKIFYKPVSKIMEERKRYIDDVMSAAAISIEKADSILKDKDAKISETLNKTKKIISDRSLLASQKGQERINAAKSEAAEKLSEAKKSLRAEAEDIENRVKLKVDEIADEIVSKVMRIGVHK